MAVRLQGVAVRFGDVHALQNVTLELGPGVTGLLGANGAGKSTLLGVLSGLLIPSEGLVSVDGVPLENRSTWRAWKMRIGVLPQHFRPAPRLKVRELVEYAAWLRLVPKTRAHALVSQALGVVGMSERAADQVRTLSGGMIQRLGIACAIVHQPDVLLLDEPANGLDIEQRSFFREVIRHLPAESCTLISSHLAEDIAALSSDVITLAHGQVQYVGSLSQFCGVADGVRPNAAEVEASYLSRMRSTVP